MYKIKCVDKNNKIKSQIFSLRHERFFNENCLPTDHLTELNFSNNFIGNIVSEILEKALFTEHNNDFTHIEIEYNNKVIESIEFE